MKLLLSFVLFLVLAACGEDQKKVENNRSSIDSSGAVVEDELASSEEGFELSKETTVRIKEWLECPKRYGNGQSSREYKIIDVIKNVRKNLFSCKYKREDKNMEALRDFKCDWSSKLIVHKVKKDTSKDKYEFKCKDDSGNIETLEDLRAKQGEKYKKNICVVDEDGEVTDEWRPDYGLLVENSLACQGLVKGNENAKLMFSPKTEKMAIEKTVSSVVYNPLEVKKDYAIVWNKMLGVRQIIWCDKGFLASDDFDFKQSGKFSCISKRHRF